MSEKVEKEDKFRYAIIPLEVLASKTLSPGAKLLYGEILSLSMLGGKCIATNATLAQRIGAYKDSIRKWLRKLENHSLIETQIRRNKTGAWRTIYPYPPERFREKCQKRLHALAFYNYDKVQKDNRQILAVISNLPSSSLQEVLEKTKDVV